MTKGILYIVATPIGNLEDITFRAVRILKEVDLIAAEDTRHTRKLLSHFGISKPLTSYFDHNKKIKGAYILEQLLEGLSVALVSDAGTPSISDPGYQLVRDAVAAEVTIVPVPGPSAAVAALSASGLSTDRFAFEGFLPSRQGKRRQALLALKDEPRVLIFYESPRRLLAMITDLSDVFGDRQVVICRELTKIHEEFIRGTVTELMESLKGREIKGEVVVLVSPAKHPLPGSSEESGDWRDILRNSLADNAGSFKDVVRQVAIETGISRSIVYAEALKMKDL